MDNNVEDIATLQSSCQSYSLSRLPSLALRSLAQGLDRHTHHTISCRLWKGRSHRRNPSCLLYYVRRHLGQVIKYLGGDQLLWAWSLGEIGGNVEERRQNLVRLIYEQEWLSEWPLRGPLLWIAVAICVRTGRGTVDIPPWIPGTKYFLASPLQPPEPTVQIWSQVWWSVSDKDRDADPACWPFLHVISVKGFMPDGNPWRAGVRKHQGLWWIAWWQDERSRVLGRPSEPWTIC